MQRQPWLITLIAVLLVAACSGLTGRNYMDPAAPRFTGGAPDTARPAAVAGANPGATVLRVVTFNIQFARNIDAAIRLLATDADLRGADLIALQEMDEAGAARIAAALSLRYVYYPATVHPANDKNFGNAILSRWPLVADRKLLLPHQSDLSRTQRIAVCGTIAVGGRRIRVYSVHLGTSFEIDPDRRADQLGMILDDAAASPDPVIIVGDLNSHAIGELAVARGYEWPTRDIGRTKWLFGWDHVLLCGFPPGAVRAAGRTGDTGGASDHRAVWTVLDLGAGALPSGSGTGPR